MPIIVFFKELGKDEHSIDPLPRGHVQVCETKMQILHRKAHHYFWKLPTNLKKQSRNVTLRVSV